MILRWKLLHTPESSPLLLILFTDVFQKIEMQSWAERKEKNSCEQSKVSLDTL